MLSLAECGAGPRAKGQGASPAPGASRLASLSGRAAARGTGASTDPAHIPAVKARAIQQLDRYWREIDQRLRDAPYLVAGSYSVCGIHLYVLARWYVDVRDRGHEADLQPLHDLTEVTRTCAGIEARPAVRRTLAADEIAPVAT